MKDYSFGNYICALRLRSGLSQFQLGTLVGVSDKAVSKWENGDAKPRIGTCYRLAEVLGVTIDELLSCETNNKVYARKELDEMNSHLWDQAYSQLSIFGEKPPIICYSRLATEKQVLYETDIVQIFAVIGQINKVVGDFEFPVLANSPVTSSFTAWLLGATRVNPLPPHYRCPKCGKTEFVPNIDCGFDLPPKRCTCGEVLIRDGHNIPFEEYEMDKQLGTEIELRVSEKTKEIAISTIRNFYNGVAEVLPVKYIFPDGRPTSIEKYVILDNKSSKPQVQDDGYWYAIPEDFHEWRNKEIVYTIVCSHELQKLHTLQELTYQKSPDLIQLATPTMAERLYQKKRKKFGFLDGMTKRMDENEAHNFNLLLHTYGFLYGTGEWPEFSAGDDKYVNGDEESLIMQGRVSLHELPVFREDVWSDISVALSRDGILDKGIAFQVVNDIRRGRYLFKGMSKECEEILRTIELPEWYPEYLKKVRYLFPKGHSVSHMILDIVLEWYAIEFPREYSEVSKLDELFESGSISQ